jgi:hypothetical protein
MRTRTDKARAGSLEELEHQDQVLQELLRSIDWDGDGGVEDRYDYGNSAKEIIRHVGTREAAALDVAHGIVDIAELAPTANRMLAADIEIRHHYAEAGRLSRGIRGIDLNVAQDFDAAFWPLASAVEAEVDWELAGELEHIESVVHEQGLAERFHSGQWVRHHAPTSLNPTRERWFERLPVTSFALTLWDHMRDYPKAARGRRRR